MILKGKKLAKHKTTGKEPGHPSGCTNTERGQDMEAPMGVLAWFGTMFLLWTLGTAAVWSACRVAAVRRRARRE